MKVYSLPNSSSQSVLLLGDVDFVTDFAEKLQAASVSFYILPAIGIDEDFDDDFSEGIPERSITGSDPAEFGKFAPYVVREPGSLTIAFSHIVMLSVAPLNERIPILEIACSLNPQATIITSVHSNTATEIGLLANQPERITGVTLGPGITHHASSADICAGLNTNPQHLESAAGLLRTLGYVPNIVEDRVALVQLRVLVMLINEAAFAVMEGVAHPADIDNAMKLGVNYPRGLLAWADKIGLDVVLIVLEALHREYQQERYRPCVLLKQYVRAGWLGIRSGRGFYTY
ncbi:MAG: 3-hydroxybutyryl-CoA dehydrogenase [Chlorobi bacterium]|nr:MAG: 3-hydroxybutyryl-CoA dehydrogenase [Bacteroidota bacterium]KXK35772.1 MAG: 3-hydroxyacyl-CoA dehydrogenase nad-binding protein [Chlorobi bacterium OLB6]MBE2265264.1 3-hydroxybutyryl-CoA dehydrogenase [Flavobacteriales bacterium]MBL1160273.1 3-hydroxybutyryl-CoA dehydrogenase [Chlorobiota bacterium]MBW7853411.1 3-hydroxybutyryl-CoA dehydrogenase [Candidatus Kapabacteria bacterium]MCC6330458.1 3-hydroxybutyryl-CoA dehydrogenase [Ignavibacteria bacterium]